jgi:hypothetical protein
MGTLMRHLFSDGALRTNDAANTPLAERRACGARRDSAGSAGPLGADSLGEPVSSTPHCNSADLDRKTSRSPHAADTTGTRSTENPPRSSRRVGKYWTSVPLPGETPSAAPSRRWEGPGGRPASLLPPWAFGLPGALVLPHSSRPIPTSGRPGNHVVDLRRL